jgi:hypothetical protein
MPFSANLSNQPLVSCSVMPPMLTWAFLALIPPNMTSVSV